MSLPIVTVTTGPADRNVATLAAVAGELGVTVGADATVDAKITRLIKVASSTFENELGRPPWRATYSEQLPGDGGVYLPLARWPIESIASISLDGVAITASEYSIAYPERSKVYREDGWQHTMPTHAGLSGAGAKNLIYTAAYTAGWVMPGKIGDWTADTAYTAGTFVRPVSDLTITVLFECTTAGTTGSTEPTWDETAGNTTVDNSATWTARNAVEMPEVLQEAALAFVADMYREGVSGPPAGVKRERLGPQEIEYSDGPAGGAMASAIRAVLRHYR